MVVAETLEKPQKLYLQGDVLKHMCTLDVKTTVMMFQKKTHGLVRAWPCHLASLSLCPQAQ